MNTVLGSSQNIVVLLNKIKGEQGGKSWRKTYGVSVYSGTIARSSNSVLIMYEKGICNSDIELKIGTNLEGNP